MEKWQLEQLRRLNIEVIGFSGNYQHCLKSGKDKIVGLTELQFADVVLGTKRKETKRIIREYLELLDKNCKYVVDINLTAP